MLWAQGFVSSTLDSLANVEFSGWKDVAALLRRCRGSELRAAAELTLLGENGSDLVAF